MRKLWRNDERGSSLVEMALVSLFLIMLLAGAIDFGGAFHAYIVIRNASREGARIASRLPCNVDRPSQHEDLKEAITQAVIREARLNDDTSPDGIDLELNGTITIDPDPVEYGCQNAGDPIVVIVEYNHATTFGGLLGMDVLPMKVETSMVYFGSDQLPEP